LKIGSQGLGDRIAPQNQLARVDAVFDRASPYAMLIATVKVIGMITV
jgi:hypothetical protein